jgi:disulfide oxidoreductase YuzD
LAYSSAQRACSSGASMPRSAETGPHLDARLKRVAVDDAHHLGRIDGLQIELA